MKLLREILERVCIVLGALLFMQLPLFIVHYQQNLSGHVSELRFQVNHMEISASKTGKSIEQYIQKFVSHDDHDFSSQGITMQKTQKRYLRLSKSLSLLKKSSLISRPFIFFSSLDYEIVRSTLSNFGVGIPLSIEGLFYAIAGMLFGFLIFSLMRKMTQKMNFSKNH